MTRNSCGELDLQSSTGQIRLVPLATAALLIVASAADLGHGQTPVCLATRLRMALALRNPYIAGGYWPAGSYGPYSYPGWGGGYGYGWPATSGLSDPLAQQALGYADLVRALAEADLNRSQAVVNLMKGRKLKLEGDWQTMEVWELWRQTKKLREAEWAADRDLDRLQRRSNQLTAFFNGRLTPENCAAFQWALRHIPVSEELGSFLAAEVPPLAGEDFVSGLEMFQVLESDGSLKPPPAGLRRSAARHRLELARSAFAEQWRRTLDLIASRHELTVDHIRDLQSACRRWQQVAAGHQAGLPPAARSTQRRYLTALRHLVGSLYRPQRVALLAELVERGGFGFPGGTTAELLEHLQALALSVRPGSQAQAILARIGQPYREALAGMISETRTRIEQLAARSPARNAATRQAIINGSYLQNAASGSYRPAPVPGTLSAAAELMPGSPLWFRWSQTVPDQGGFARPVAFPAATTGSRAGPRTAAPMRPAPDQQQRAVQPLDGYRVDAPRPDASGRGDTKMSGQRAGTSVAPTPLPGPDTHAESEPNQSRPPTGATGPTPLVPY